MLQLALCVLSTTLLPRYDVVVVGTGLKESLLAGLLASHGKAVLQLDGGGEDSGESLDLQQLAEALEGPDAPILSANKLGDVAEYSVERAPKMFVASGQQLQLLVGSGAWQHMNPPGFKRVHRAFMYRQRPDGTADVHRVLANSEDVVKTRSLTALEKARVVQFFLWVDRYDESDSSTHALGPLSKKALNLNKLSAASFIAQWELPKTAVAMVVRGMALKPTGAKPLKRLKAVELVRRLKRYKAAYKTFPHMTSPYVYPAGGFGASLPQATSTVLEANGGAREPAVGIDGLITTDDGSCGGVVAGGSQIEATCVVASASAVPEHVAPSYHIVRLYAVLSHAPNLCKDASSCQLIMPAEHCGRAHDVYLASFGATHGVAPRGRWVVVASTRVEGAADDGTALAIAKRELASVLPLLKPSRKLFAEVVPYCEPRADGVPERLLVLSSPDETSYFDGVEDEVSGMFERITGEPLGGRPPIGAVRRAAAE